jgi:hypothetical protein
MPPLHPLLSRITATLQIKHHFRTWIYLFKKWSLQQPAERHLQDEPLIAPKPKLEIHTKKTPTSTTRIAATQCSNTATHFLQMAKT